MGVVEPDFTSVILGTGFDRFSSPTGIDGLAKWTDEQLELLAVIANAPHQGQFRAFIQQAKEIWPIILVWHVHNGFLDAALARYGFQPITSECDGETVPGWRWIRQP